MNKSAPFSLLESFFQSFNFSPEPPVWAVQEGQRRIVLLLNHVLMQEPQAMERLVRQKGNTVLAQWRHFTFKVAITPAGLFSLAGAQDTAPADLTLVVTEESPLRLLQTLARREKPAIRIAGDVQLAAEINWLADHVRWDVEEDLSRIVGDAAAHGAVQLAKSAAQVLERFVAQRAPQSPAPDTAA